MIRRPFSTAMIDMLLCTVIALFIAVAPPLKVKEGVEALADYQITMRWERGVDIDVDMYLMTPDAKVVWYQNQHEGNVNVDRDDLGLDNDTDDNVETIFIREPADGTYYLSVHNYEDKGAPVGNVTFTIQDKHGVWPIPPVTVPMPSPKVEIAAIEFKVEGGKIVNWAPGYYLIRKSGLMTEDPGEDSGPGTGARG